MTEKPKKRRTKTSAPGVYKSCSGRYEIQHYDSDGKNVFQAVPGSFEDAKAARAAIIDKISRGEPVRRSKTTFGEFADTVIETVGGRPRTVQQHRYHLDRHLRPRFQGRRLGEISTDDVARLAADMRKGFYYEKVDGRYVRKQRKGGYAGWTISGTLSTLGVVMRRAKRQGLIPANPVSDLERYERPNLKSSEKRVLSDAEIGKLLDNGGSFRPLLALLIFSGLRIGEALGLKWEDIDAGFVHVRRQLGRDREAGEIKTAAGRRDVVLMPQLASVLAAHRLASLHCSDGDYVFAAADGRGRDHRSTSRGIERAVERAKLGTGVSAHTMRHTFASQLIIGLGLDPVRVSKLLGHSSSAFTCAVYAHLFEQARHADELRERMADGYGRLLDGNKKSTAARNSPKPRRIKVAAISATSG